ncbi:Serine/threonine-protein phosphatase 5 [Strongyloides ratti]|uniref:Serine/threonine-protein phosphatase n=1 Tax=Strongyloides ratti TaxID=34506 RepID=A0A090L927_STRRB|nr:Serine/threonine-protein phosphatase 5 [Strongyloides ratti]CEF66271.1 Serine/threonine-protein phosphatase 5 [Strongyloides ratti]
MNDGKVQKVSNDKKLEQAKTISKSIYQTRKNKLKEVQTKSTIFTNSKNKELKNIQKVNEVQKGKKEKKENYPTQNVSQTQINNLSEFNKNCGQCTELKTSSSYYKTLLMSYLDLIIESYKNNNFNVDATKLITLPIFSNICHRVSEILAAESTLLLINSETQSESFLVLSDIHGAFEVLIYNFFNHHCLPKNKIIILGDYVDKGADDAFICLLLFLCKIVWPNKLFLLRGNHEIRDMNRQKDFPDNCVKLLGDISTFYLFNFVFERMPIAAIWNNNVYLAHGGISQWINSRDDVTNIKRPLKLNRTLKSRLLITDILWSDPYRKTYSKKEEFQKYFCPSKRGCGFAYSKEGLEEIMKCLNVSMVVRGHQTSSKGFVEEYKGICYTIHSKPSSTYDSFGSSCLLYLDDNGNVLLKPLKYKPLVDKEEMLNMLDKLRTVWKNSKSSTYQFQKNCPYCIDKENYINELACQERILITHAQLTMWMTDFKIRTIIEIEFGNKAEKKWKNPEKLLAKFPIYFDFCVWSKIGESVRPNSIMNKKEKEIVYMILKKIENMDDKSILTGNPNLSVDKMPFLCLNQINDNKRKNSNGSSDDSEGGSDSDEIDENISSNDVSEEEEEN